MPFQLPHFVFGIILESEREMSEECNEKWKWNADTMLSECVNECQQVFRKFVTKLWSRGQPSTSQLLRLPFLVAIAKASVKRIVIFSMKSIWSTAVQRQRFRANWELNSPFSEEDLSVVALSSIGELRKGWSGRQQAYSGCPAHSPLAAGNGFFKSGSILPA